MNNIEKYNENVFESIKHIDEDGEEYWKARELMNALEYNKWENFHKVIKNAIASCDNSNANINDHFPEVRKLINIAKGGIRKVLDYKLSRYACYLIVQNADPHKETVALGQTYFAIQTRRMELTDEEYKRLSEDDKRLYRSAQTKDGNKILYKVAREKGVKNFDRFTNAGYKGLYNGETADDIAKRKGLRYREDILDNMGSVELGANIFRITQTEDLLRLQDKQNENMATDTHFRVGKEVRNTIKRLGGTMPENLPTPKKSLKEIERRKNYEKNNNKRSV